MSKFDDHLWSHLVREHDAAHAAPARTGSRRRPRPLVLTVGAGGLAVAAALTVTLLVGAGTSAPPAYAFSENPDGTVTVTLNDVATGIPALNAEFARRGIRERAVPIEASCTTGPEVGFDAPNNGPGMHGMSTTFTFSAAHPYLDPGYTGFIAARQVGPGHVEMAIGAMRDGTIPSCFPTTSPKIYPVAPGSPSGTATAPAGGAATVTAGATATSTTTQTP